MNLRAGVAIAGAAVLFSIGAAVAQEPARKASLEGVVVRTGMGTPLAGARVMLTVIAARGGSAGPGVPGGGGIGSPEGISPSDIDFVPERQIGLLEQIQAGGGAPFGLLSSASGRGRVPPVPIPPVMTDAKGHFFFGNLDPGVYRLQVQANGYLPQDYGQRYAGGPATPITLIAGQEKTDVAVNLTPAGNISGRLRDSNEQPLANVSVQLLRPTYDANGNKRLQIVGGGRTDDRGEFRIFWVSPGRYYLKAGTESDSSIAMLALMGGGARGLEGGNPNEVPSTAATAYYPGALDLGGARAVEVLPGADLAAVDWALPTQPGSHRVSGRLVDARTGKAPAEAQVVIVPVTPGFAISQESLQMEAMLGGGLGMGRRYNPATGLMEFRNLAPGTYLISAVIQDYGGRDDIDIPPGVDSGVRGGIVIDEPRYGGGGGLVTGSAIVTVANVDVENVVVTLVPAGSLTGKLQLEGDFPGPPAPRGAPRGAAAPRFNVRLVSQGGAALAEMIGGPSGGVAGPDGTFRLNNVGPGEYRVSVSSLPGNAFLKSAQLSGVDVLNAPLMVTGPAAGVLDVVVSANGGQVQGNLLDERSEPVPVTPVVLIPNRSRGRVDLYKMVTTNEEGHFSITGVAPGDYKLFAWQSIVPYSWYDPEIVEQSEDRSSPVHVSESSTETVAVKLIPAGGSQ